MVSRHYFNPLKLYRGLFEYDDSLLLVKRNSERIVVSESLIGFYCRHNFKQHLIIYYTCVCVCMGWGGGGMLHFKS